MLILNKVLCNIVHSNKKVFINNSISIKYVDVCDKLDVCLEFAVEFESLHVGYVLVNQHGEIDNCLDIVGNTANTAFKSDLDDLIRKDVYKFLGY